MIFIRPMFFAGILLIVAMLIASKLLGNVFGAKKVTWKESITRIGAMQLWVSFGFLIIGLSFFVYTPIGGFLLPMLIMSSVCLTVYGNILIHQIHLNRIMLFIVSFIFIQLLNMMLVSNLLFGENSNLSLNDLLSNFN